mgnify:FL=1
MISLPTLSLGRIRLGAIYLACLSILRIKPRSRLHLLPVFDIVILLALYSNAPLSACVARGLLELLLILVEYVLLVFSILFHVEHLLLLVVELRLSWLR